MSSPYYVGRYKDDAQNEPNRGWIVGKFKDEPPRKNDEVEIMYWEFPVGPTAHPLKVSSIIECTFILKGSTKAIIDDKEITLSAGDYVVIEPGISNNLVKEILEDAQGLTIKAPSDPSAKRVLE